MKKISFSANQKSEIINGQIKNICCRRALLNGCLCAKAYIESDTIKLSVENDDVANYISELCNEIFLKIPEITIPKEGGRCRILTLKSNSAAKYIEKIKSSHAFADVCRQKCAACHSSFWRGVFLVSGRITDPEKQFYLEFSLTERISLFKNLFEKQELAPHEISRKGENLLYFKRKNDIQDFFAKAGMNNTVFSLLESYIKTEMRQSANRISNCETHNIMRAVDASQKHINAIQDLMDSNLLSSLPEELERTARLRVQYADLTLSQLAAVSVTPITKSGLSHRLNKILMIAEKKLGKKYT